MTSLFQPTDGQPDSYHRTRGISGPDGSRETVSTNRSSQFNRLHLQFIQGDSFGTRPKKMRISKRIFIRFWTCIYDYIPCFMRSMSILEEMLEMFATTVQAELNATLHVRESGLQDVLTNRSNFTSNVVFQFLYVAWLVGISFSF